MCIRRIICSFRAFFSRFAQFHSIYAFIIMCSSLDSLQRSLMYFNRIDFQPTNASTHYKWVRRQRQPPPPSPPPPLKKLNIIFTVWPLLLHYSVFSIVCNITAFFSRYHCVCTSHSCTALCVCGGGAAVHLFNLIV